MKKVLNSGKLALVFLLLASAVGTLISVLLKAADVGGSLLYETHPGRSGIQGEGSGLSDALSSFRSGFGGIWRIWKKLGHLLLLAVLAFALLFRKFLFPTEQHS